MGRDIKQIERRNRDKRMYERKKREKEKP